MTMSADSNPQSDEQPVCSESSDEQAVEASAAPVTERSDDTFTPPEDEATRSPVLSDKSRSPYLRVFGADEGCYQVDLDWGAIVVGRGGKAQVNLPDLSVSREHARLTPRDGSYIIEDCGSKLGTAVNGHQIDTLTPLKHGDSIQIAQFVLQYRTDNIGARILPGKFGLLPSSMGLRYRFVHYDPSGVFNPGDTIAVGQGGILVPLLNDPPPEACIEVELTWPDRRKLRFLAELLCLVPGESRLACLKLHQVDEDQYKSVILNSNRDGWVTVNEEEAAAG
jgi:hypothetical protein